MITTASPSRRNPPACSTRSGPAPVVVGVLADDDLAEESVTAYLRSRRELLVRPGARRHEAEVLVVFTPEVTDEGLDRIAATVADAPTPPRLVLVAGAMREQHLWRAIALGLTGVVPRPAATWDRVVGAVVGSRAGRGEMSPTAVGWLLDQVRTLQTEVLDPAGLTVAGLTVREVEVLRLLAEGMDTTEIAGVLNYSERTIKNIIHGMISRLGLRNRSHAVAYALRAGAL